MKPKIRKNTTHVILNDAAKPGVYVIHSQHKSYGGAMRLFKEISKNVMMGHTLIEKVSNLKNYKIKA